MSNVTTAAPAPAGQPPSTARTPGDRLKALVRYPETGITVVAIVIAIVFEILNGAFLTSEVPVLLASTAQYGLIAVGEAMLMITGEIDLSAAKIYSTTPFFAFYLSAAGVPWPAAIPLALVGAAGIGWVNGFITVRLGVPSLISTLGMLFLLNGAILTVSHSQPARTPDSFINIFLGSDQQNAGTGISQIAAFLWLVAVALAFTVVLRRTRFGLHTIAVGSNLLAARELGIRTERTKILNFVIMAVLAGLAGIIESCASGSIDPSAGDNTLTLYAIAAAVIGGTSLFGGSGTVIGALIGSFVVASLNDGLPLVGAQAGFADVPLGIAIVAAMILNIKLTALRARQV
ncbi:MAG: ABC transporter permease [Candidatus Velthaea sp.]|jgi:simple sugar transport system permease protein